MSDIENQPKEKPELKPEGPVLLSLKVKDQGGQEVIFKAKQGMKLEKLMHAFDKSQGKVPGTYRFFFEGQRLQKTDTPESMGMEDEDIIEAFLEQLGGVMPCYWGCLRFQSWYLTSHDSGTRWLGVEDVWYQVFLIRFSLSRPRVDPDDDI